MIVLINGPFGVGKSTVGKLLRNILPGSAVYDPEWAGLVLMRLPKWVGIKGSGTDDFQDIVLWRRCTVAGIRLYKWRASGPVIVPMSRGDYLDEVIAGTRKYGTEIRVFCLKASLPTIRNRLTERGGPSEGPGAEWIARRNIECAAAHRDPHFGEPIDTEDMTALETAQYIFNGLEDR